MTPPMMNRPPLRLGACLVAIAVCLTLSVPAPAQAQTALDVIDQGRTALQQGFNASDASALRRARATFLRAAGDRQHGYLAHYYVGLSSSRLANLSEDGALEHVDDAITHLERVVELRPGWAEGHALLASVYGRKAGLRPMAGMVLGPRTSAAMERAQELAPNNPRVVFLKASSKYFRPRMWGGNKAEGLAGFRRAAALFARAGTSARDEPSWGHDEALTWLGIALAREGELAESRRALGQALQLNPNNAWVRDQLIPQVEARIAEAR